MPDVQRFLIAQEGVYDNALAEIQAGKKRGHWMWFIFPQLQGLGHSAMAKRYGIADLDEARAFLEHPILGQRLKRLAQAVCLHQSLSAQAIFGTIDALKLHSSMTLFSLAQPSTAAPFLAVLQHYYQRQPCAATLTKLAISPFTFSTLVTQS